MARHSRQLFPSCALAASVGPNEYITDPYYTFLEFAAGAPNHLLFQVLLRVSASLLLKEMYFKEWYMSVVKLNPHKSGHDAFTQQVQSDINFLEARLNIMRTQHTPNQQVIRTYEDMLQSRLDVLTRLQDENHTAAKIG